MPAEFSLQQLSLGVAILGAGASKRMGQPKLLLPWGKTSILGHLLQQWSDIGASQIAVVSAEGHAAFDQELSRLGVLLENRIVNPAPELGMFSSIQCAARWSGWKSGLTHWSIVLGDQPHLRTTTLRTLIAFAETQSEKVCQPGRNGRPRHPVILPRGVWEQLAQATEPDLKQFLRNRPEQTAWQEIDDPGLDFDIDAPADYERALERFRPGAD